MFPRCAVFILILVLMITLARQGASQPYASSVVGTDFDFITASDPSAFRGLKFLKQGRAEMPDKRTENAPLFQQAYIFAATFKDDTAMNIYVHVDIGDRNVAEAEARRYVHPLGKLPAVLRQGVKRVVVHPGGKNITAFADDGLIVVYAANASQRIATHDLEETIFHESVHAAWDAKHARSTGWIRAQRADGGFATVYAKSKPLREDLAETALFAYTLLNHPERLPASDRAKLRKAIPHRIAYIGQLLAAGSAKFKRDVAEPNPTPQSDKRRPNIALILVDDLGWSDVGCYGHKYHRTPNIDGLAKQGMRMTQAYAPAPICSASRASILTGKTPARLGFEFVTKNMAGHQQLDAQVLLKTPAYTLNLPVKERTIADYLTPLGYNTAFFGKWHVSQHYKGRYLAWHPDFGPRRQGFQTAVEDFGDHPYAWRGKPRGPDLPDGEFPQDSMVQRTATFIRNQQGKQKPWFVMASSFYVHTPVKNRCQWLVKDYAKHLPEQSPNREKRLEYAAFVETLDHHVGTILKAIDESGQRNNTLVVLMSDNGGHPEYCANAPLRGSKWHLYEGGIRVPMLARWPGTIAAGSTCDTPVVGYDLLPTFVDVASHSNHAELEGADGVSLRPALTNGKWRRERSLVWHFPYYHPEATYSKARKTTGINDFQTSQTKPQSAIRSGSYKLLHFAEDDRVELYDLSNDIGEQNDLSNKHPRKAKQLRTLLEHQLNAMKARRAVQK